MGKKIIWERTKSGKGATLTKEQTWERSNKSPRAFAAVGASQNTDFSKEPLGSIQSHHSEGTACPVLSLHGVCSLLQPWQGQRAQGHRAPGAAGLGTPGWTRACRALPLLARFPLSRDRKSDFSRCREAGFWRRAMKSAPHRGLVHQQWVGVAVPAQLEEFVGSAGAFFEGEMFLHPGFHHKPCCQSPVGE